MIPKSAPLSTHARIMVDMFQLLNSNFPDVRKFVGDDDSWDAAAREVLAALDALVDADQPPAAEPKAGPQEQEQL